MIIYLIRSNDDVKYKLAYEITSSILKLITSISEKIGEKNKTI